jgi:hypothetical protein
MVTVTQMQEHELCDSGTLLRHWSHTWRGEAQGTVETLAP